MDSEVMAVLVWIIYAAIAAGVVYLIWRQVRATQSAGAAPRSPEPLRTTRSKSGLQSDILQEGEGEGAKNRDMLTVHFEAFLTTGEKVDSSYDRGRTLTFKLGAGAVISGWDQALKGMKTGEKRKVTVPAQLAYGKKGKNKVPPNSTIIFEITLMKIES